MIGVRYDLNDADIREAILKLETLIGSEGLAAFLGTTVAPYLRERAQQRFASEGDDVTGPWAPLGETTVAIREATGFPGEHPINRRTGELEEWVTNGDYFAYPTGVGASLQYPAGDPPASVRLKLQTAQKGKKSPPTVPRPVLGVNERDMLFVMAALNAAIEAAGR